MHRESSVPECYFKDWGFLSSRSSHHSEGRKLVIIAVGYIPLLGGSWVLISRVTILITHIRGLRTLLITTPEPPSKVRLMQATVSERFEISRLRVLGLGI